MNKLIQKIFENRGYTQEFLREINNPEYQMLKDIDALCVRLKEIHDADFRIVVYPDFDMDGISAGVLGYAGLCELGFHAGLYIPDPKSGYGITQKSVADLLHKYPGTNVIITCDTGIGAVEAASYCRIAGVEFIVTDHHKQETTLSDASFVIDPMRRDETYPHMVCGAFVLWQVLMRYAQLYGNYMMQDQIARLKVFAGIGTVSDSMPLLYENRQVVRDAVMICRLIYGDGSPAAVSGIPGTDQYKLCFWGLYDFMKVCEENGIIKSSEDIDEEFFGWYLAPIFNSAKRLNNDMSYAFGVFFCGNIAVQNPRHDYAEYLYKLNNERKKLVAQKMNEILASPQPYAPYIYLSDADSGILGLLATKLMQKSGVPTFVLAYHGVRSSGNQYSGSGRTPEWFNAITLLHDLDYVFIAGHEHAFGFGIDTETHLYQFYSYLSTLVPNIMSQVEVVEFKPDYVIDTEWEHGDTGIDLALFDEYLTEIEQYRPFGKGFELPKGCVRFRNQDVVQWKRMGNAQQHLKIVLPGGLDVICWNQGHMIDQKDKSDVHMVYGDLGRSEFMGVLSINFTGEFVEQ